MRAPGPRGPGLVLTLAASALLAADAGAQVADPPPSQGPVRVFLDCQAGGGGGGGFGGCNEDDFRTEIRFVAWVGEPAAADVHVIITEQDAGAGTRHVFDYVGRGPLAGLEDRLTLTLADTDTEAEEVAALVDLMRAGLVRFVALRGGAAGLDIRAREGSREEETAAGPRDDPWHQWVFRVGMDAEFSGEERQTDREMGAEISANRTTAEWKIDVELGGDMERREVELNDGRVFINETDDWEAAALVVRSVADHWSSGFEVEASTSTQYNRSFGARSALALEWSLYPYEEANRRQFVVHYQLGFSSVRYEELTIFDRTEETLTDHRLAVAYDVRQPWGGLSVSARYSGLLRDLSNYRVALEGGLSFRIFRGLELDVEGSYERIRDQIYLPAEGLSDEEILVQRRQLPTGYEYETSLGLSYRFGSIFNDVVNNRFPWVVRQFF